MTKFLCWDAIHNVRTPCNGVVKKSGLQDGICMVNFGTLERRESMGIDALAASKF